MPAVSPLSKDTPDPSRRASELVALLSARKLDRTLTSVTPATAQVMAPWPSTTLTERLGGGVPRGQMSEITGPVSSGRTSLAWAALAAATARGEWVALVDTFDRFDPEPAAEAGIVLPRMLWVRGQALSKTAGAVDPAWVPGERAVQGPGTLLERTVDRAIKALNLIVQSGVCTLVVLDLVDVPSTALTRVPRSTWLRIQRIIEGSDTAVILLASAPVARSAEGLSIAMGVDRDPGAGRMSRQADPSPAPRHAPCRVQWKGTHDRARRLGGVATSLRATSPRGFVGHASVLVD